MRRAIVVAGALLALTACQDAEPRVVYRTSPTEAPAEEDEDVLALEFAWSTQEDEICAGLAALGGVVTPEIERLAIDSYVEGYGQPISPAAEERLIELLKEC